LADSVPTALENQIELSAAANPLTFVEGGKAKDFILTVKNITWIAKLVPPATAYLTPLEANSSACGSPKLRPTLESIT
jgi:hypothetical protein